MNQYSLCILLSLQSCCRYSTSDKLVVSAVITLKNWPHVDIGKFYYNFGLFCFSNHFQTGDKLVAVSTAPATNFLWDQ
jgi:hypothetical protein